MWKLRMFHFCEYENRIFGTGGGGGGERKVNSSSGFDLWQIHQKLSSASPASSHRQQTKQPETITLGKSIVIMYQ
jgi:hypothetical protein